MCAAKRTKTGKLGMRRNGRNWLLLLGTACLMSGCALSSSLRHQSSCDPSRLATHYALDQSETVLAPEQVQRWAVENSGLAKALDSDSEGGDGHPCLACTASQKRNRLAKLLKAYAADEVRNQSAALALDAYYRLAEARLRIRLIYQARDIAQRFVDQAEEMQAKGLAIPTQLTDLQRQVSETAADQAKLELARDRLTEQIRQFSDGKTKSRHFGIIEVFHVINEPLEECEMIAIGLKYRPDLNLLRAALNNLDASTLPLIRKLLGGSSPLLGEKVKRCVPALECLPRVLPLLAQGELEKVRKELTALLCERERQAVSEIRQALRRVETSVQLAKLAQERESLTAKRYADIEERFTQKLAGDSERLLARKEHLKARGEVLHEVIEWELARVELRRAQGLLVREVLGECGYETTGP